MFVFVVRRLLLFFPLLLGTLMGTFAFIHYGPGDFVSTAIDHETYSAIWDGTDYDYEALRHYLEILDRPFLVQFADYLCGGLCVPNAIHGGVLRGDWGQSWASQREITDIVRTTLPVSAQLGLAGLIVLYSVGVPLGILAAVKRNTWVDRWIVTGSIAANSAPIFVLGPMVMIVVVLGLRIMDDQPAGWEGLFSTKAILPVALTSLGGMLVVVRMTRAGMLEVLSQGYVLAARAKGLPERMVVRRHILRNALPPVLKGARPMLVGFLTGQFLVEFVFEIPGFSSVFITAFLGRDFPMILAGMALVTAILFALNFVADLAYRALDPRVRYE